MGGWTVASSRIRSQPQAHSSDGPYYSIFLPALRPQGFCFLLMYSASQDALGQKTHADITLTLQIHPRLQHLCSPLSLGCMGLLPETCSGSSVVLGPVMLINTSPASRILLFCRMLSHPTPQSTTRDPAGFRMCLLAHPWKNSAALLGHRCCSMPCRILWGWKSRL